MKDSKALWLAWLQSKTFKCLPSELLGVTEQPAAFYFNRAVFTFGQALEAELDRVGAVKGKRTEGQAAMARQQIMARWLGTQRFAEPTPRR